MNEHKFFHYITFYNSGSAVQRMEDVLYRVSHQKLLHATNYY